MGRLEKIVVLTVVFLIAVILGISLNEKDEVADPLGTDELAGTELDRPAESTEAPPWVQVPAQVPVEEPAASGRLLGGPVSAGAEDGAPTAPVEVLTPDAGSMAALEERPELEDVSAAALVEPPAGGRALLNSSVRTETTPEPEVTDGELLVTTVGLVDTPYEELMLYTWRDGDTFTSVARRYYGDLGMVRLLRTANEGLTERDLNVGDQIFVPLRDTVDRADVYTVSEGDTLSGIAQKVYGDASRWRALYDANRDLLGSPDELALGQVLRVPPATTSVQRPAPSGIR